MDLNSRLEALLPNFNENELALSDFPQLLELANGGDPIANAKVTLLSNRNYPRYIEYLSQTFINEQVSDSVKTTAALVIKNALATTKDVAREQALGRWFAIPEDGRNTVKEIALKRLSYHHDALAGSCAQLLAAIVNTELPLGTPPYLIQRLLQNLLVQDSYLKKQSLSAIGYICESFGSFTVSVEISNAIIAAIVQCIFDKENDSGVLFVSLQALTNSLGLAKGIFEDVDNRNALMQHVCNATQNESDEVKVAAFQCIVAIMQHYYDKMALYMESGLIEATVFAITDRKGRNERKNVANNASASHNLDDDGVTLQAIEFWSTVCEEEIELKEEIAYDPSCERVPANYAGRSVSQVIPLLLDCLVQTRDSEEDEWTVPKAAAVCLDLFSQCVNDAVVGPVIGFVQGNFQLEQWSNREAAVMAFGSIIEGPQPELLGPIVSEFLPHLLAMTEDQNDAVKDTAAWTIGRICEFIPTTFYSNHIAKLVDSLRTGLKDDDETVKHYCWGLIKLTENIKSDPSAFSVFFQQYGGIVEDLLKLTDMAGLGEIDADDTSRITSLYEVLYTLVASADKSCTEIVKSVAETVFVRLEDIVVRETGIADTNQSIYLFEIQSNLLTVLTDCIYCLPLEIVSQMGNPITHYYVKLSSNPHIPFTVLSDALTVIGFLATALGTEFEPYADYFSRVVNEALQNPSESELCLVAVRVAGDICSALGKNSLPICSQFMCSLLKNIQSPNISPIIKPAIISCFGDIASAIGESFVSLDVRESFASHDVNEELPSCFVATMGTLQQAGRFQLEEESYEFNEFLNEMFEAVVEGYVGIIQGIPSYNLWGPYLPDVFSFLHRVASNEDKPDSLTKSVIGLLDDIAQVFVKDVKYNILENQWIEGFLLSHTRDMHAADAMRAYERIKNACQ